MACEVCKKPYIPPTDADSFTFDGRPHLCKICGKSFSVKGQLKLHLESHEGNAPYVCNSCENKSSSYNLRLSKKGNFVCETCNKCFLTKRALLRHAGEHTAENILICDECGESFKNMSALKKHTVTHKPGKRKNSGDLPHQCQDCGKCFAKLKQYEAHCLNHKKYHCADCNVYFASNKLLLEHLDSGSGTCPSTVDTSIDSSISNTNESASKKHECSLCKISFTRKSALEGHIVTHFTDNHESSVEDDSDKDMDFECDLKEGKSNELCLPKLKVRCSHPCEKCSLVFSTKASFNKHMLSHKDNFESKIQIRDIRSEWKKTYTCRICKETFDLKENYKQHKLSHVTSELDKEVKNYTCQICLKVFARKKHLKKHVKLHLDDTSTDDSNFSRPLVEENSVDKSSFHDENISLVAKREKRAKNFTCSHCGKLFAGETCWRKHEAKHDGNYQDKEDSTGKSRKGKKAKPLICEFCNEDFTGKKHLFTKHRLSHTPEVCGICDARFTDRASLREHCRIHIGTEEGRRFLECSQKVLDAKNGVAQPEPKVEYIYLVLR